MELLKLHLAVAHGEQGARPTEGSSKVQLTKIQKPRISGGCSQGEFQDFQRAWKRNTKASNETDEDKLKD